MPMALREENNSLRMNPGTSDNEVRKSLRRLTGVPLHCDKEDPPALLDLQRDWGWEDKGSIFSKGLRGLRGGQKERSEISLAVKQLYAHFVLDAQAKKRRKRVQPNSEELPCGIFLSRKVLRERGEKKKR